MTEGTGTMNGGSALLVAAVLVAFAPQGVAAQDAVDDRWLPWLGCWQAVDAPADAPLMCVRPAREGGVELLSVETDGMVERRAIRADGVERALTTAECVGSESAEFSADGTRVYLRGEQTCDGGHPRTTRGLIAMIDGDQWIEVQTMEVGGRSVAWAQRYEPAPRSRVTAAGQAAIQEMADRRAQAIRAARMFASAPITVDEIIEAYARTDAEAVRVWVAEQAYTIELDADGLVRLAEAGVPDHVIDVVVAVAYPEQFALADADAQRIDRRPRRGVVYPGYPIYLDPYYSYYGWGWGSWGRGYGYGYYYRPPVVVIPRDDVRGTGRAVQGRGYTRGTASPSSSSGEARRGTPRGTATSPATTRSTGEVRTPTRPSSRQPAASSPPSRSGDRRANPRPRND